VREAFLLPWVFFILGISPLALLEARSFSAWGFAQLFNSILLAGAAAVFSRLPVRPRIQFFLTLGLGLLVLQTALEASYAFTLMEPPVLVAMAGGMGAASLLFAFFLATGEDAPLLPPLGRLGTREDLAQMAGALEGLALRRGLTALFLPKALPKEELLEEVRSGDLAFELENGYLIFLQSTPPEGLGAMIKRLRAKHPDLAFAVENWRRGSLRSLLLLLEAEAVLMEEVKP